MTPEEALTLRSSPGTPVYRFHRLRFADDAPMALEYATIVAACLPSLDAVESSLYEALERAGNRPVRALQRLRAVLLDAEQAEAAARASRATRACWSSGSASCTTAARSSSRQSYYRGDTYDFVAELSTLVSAAGSESRACSSEAARPPAVVRAQLRAQPRRRRWHLGETLRALRAARRRDLRARQLRPRGDLRRT